MAYIDHEKQRPVRQEQATLLPPPSRPRPRSTPHSSLFRWVASAIYVATTFLVVCALFSPFRGVSHTSNTVSRAVAKCHQPKALAPPKNATLDAFRRIVLNDTEYRNRSIELYSGAVRIPSESFDDNGEPGEDPRWATFPPFQDYLVEKFPLVHQNLKLEKINTLGLLYTWKGTDGSLKPLLLMSHYDVVPVNPATRDQWKYDPYSGHYDGEYIWGRGSLDTKGLLIAHMEAIEHLLSTSYIPQRTVVLSYGFDEETMLYRARGAFHLATRIEEIYGKNGVELIVDEGSGAISTLWGRSFITPGMGEKGYVDVNITLSTPGGHSSVPPAHTGIGILSSFISDLERHPYPLYLAENSPFFGLMQCGAEHADGMEKEVRRAVLKGSRKSRKALAKGVAKMGLVQKTMVQTTQATDIIYGGVKVNALPELTYVVINHRISVEQSVQTVKDRLARLAKKTAKKYGLGVDAFGEFSPSRSAPNGLLQLVETKPLEPAPMTPRGPDVLAWNVMAGTIKNVYPAEDGGEVIVAPGMAAGNTDTRFYWNLTRNIYRFSPFHGDGEHTVNEKCNMDDHLRAILFFHTLIRSMDVAR